MDFHKLRRCGGAIRVRHSFAGTGIDNKFNTKG